uniref:Uncharacterized protein n=1 Tax=Candidatus Nitrotoga fabula TaxID=2182327 RepID=A0A2X0QU77_9PROT|nr:protein of unknown function [Candidatus Nitrotoga fabula]
MSKHKNQLKKWVMGHIKGFNYGYFLTIDTIYTTGTHNIDEKLLTDFAEETRGIFRAVNIFSYGRSFQREEQLKESGTPILRNKLHEVTAYEISKGGRLHLHSILLHDGSCNRTVDQIEDHLRESCTYNRHTRLAGNNALDVRPYDVSRKNNLIDYMLKSTDFIYDRYRFCNINIS